jgi:polysaccharide export outer membrane protein
MSQNMRKAASFLVAMLLPFGGATTIAYAQESNLPGPSVYTNAPPAAAGPTDVSQLPSYVNANSSVAPALLGEQDDNYRLGTGDKLKVTVYGEDDLSGEVLVDGTGQVQLPLVGQVNAAGLTVHQFVAEVTQILGTKYLRDPKVSVAIENYRPFYIMGEVNKPGEYPYENNLSVLSAVALAGGYTFRADSDDVYVRRKGSVKEKEMPATALTKVEPGDIIRVPERIF